MLSLLGAGQGQNGVFFDFVIKTDNLSTGSSTNTQFKLPLVSTGSYNFVVNWGDGTSNAITTWNQAETTKTYSVIGTYNIKITGTLIGWVFNDMGDKLKLLSINSWGNMRLGTTQGNYFNGCANLILTSVSDVLNLIGTTSLLSAFRSCTSLNTINRINEWNVSNVINMQTMFTSSSNFNQNIEAWNVGNVTNMSNMFGSATAFNQNIGSWNVSNVTNFNNFMAGKSPANFSTTNLDAIYNGWSSRAVKPNLSISFGTAKYTSASQAGKNILTGAPNNWTITDGGI